MRFEKGNGEIKSWLTGRTLVSVLASREDTCCKDVTHEEQRYLQFILVGLLFIILLVYFSILLLLLLLLIP